jgi:hypothetical protein
MKKVFLALVFLFLLTAYGYAQKQTQTTVNLKPGGYTYFTKIYTKKSQTLAVNFDASSPVEVYVLDIDNFANWRNGNSFSSYYTSGRISRGIITLKLGNGVYYLVVSNTFSVLTSKTVVMTFFEGYREG